MEAQYTSNLHKDGLHIISNITQHKLPLSFVTLSLCMFTLDLETDCIFRLNAVKVTHMAPHDTIIFTAELEQCFLIAFPLTLPYDFGLILSILCVQQWCPENEPAKWNGPGSE